MKPLKINIQEICKYYGWREVIYAGLVGSAVVTNRNTDTDVIVLLTDTPEAPCLVHETGFSLLCLNTSWLCYKKHLVTPVGLVPSILFSSITLSQPILGNKENISLPKIKVCKADEINIAIKKNRYEKTNRKNYIVAQLFERLLKISPDLSLYSFDNVKMAKTIGANELAEELMSIYKEK